ncbi:hypothetical protein AB0395_21910 [Streptosporangium sp. NPDC051023]|uniref:hypothetical protein n=1 Tax=Streptosporangium sp. NPDC051023 TaxID=3155410 RepID=UPI00344C6878
MSTPRETALARLRHWATPGRRAQLIAAAWTAGETRIAVLAEAGNVSRQTVYTDLAEHGIAPAADRPKEEDLMPQTITVNGYTGTEELTLNPGESWHSRYDDAHPGNTITDQGEKAKATYRWLLEQTDSIMAARWYNTLAPLAASAGQARQDAQRALHRVETTWAALRNASRWQAALHVYVEAVHSAREAITTWQQAAQAFADHPIYKDRAIQSAYEQLVPSGPVLQPDTEAAAAALAELEDTHRRRQAITRETLGMAPTGGAAEE